jgi:hydroxymethylbilane synthase
MKDVPAEQPPGLHRRHARARRRLATPSSAVLRAFDDLPAGARLGTASLRRQAQALALRPDLDIQMLRGNVDTRLAKLERGEADAILLANPA